MNKYLWIAITIYVFFPVSARADEFQQYVHTLCLPEIDYFQVQSISSHSNLKLTQDEQRAFREKYKIFLGIENKCVLRGGIIELDRYPQRSNLIIRYNDRIIVDYPGFFGNNPAGIPEHNLTFIIGGKEGKESVRLCQESGPCQTYALKSLLLSPLTNKTFVAKNFYANCTSSCQKEEHPKQCKEKCEETLEYSLCYNECVYAGSESSLGCMASCKKDYLTCLNTVCRTERQALNKQCAEKCSNKRDE